YSFHRDTSNSGDGSIPLRVKQIRDIIAKHSSKQAYPSQADAPMYFSEGGPLQYASDYPKYGWSDAQLLVELLASGVSKMVVSLSAQTNDANWPGTPIYKVSHTFERLFPTPGHVKPATVSQLGGNPDAVGYVRTDPDTGLRTWIVWGKYTAPGT